MGRGLYETEPVFRSQVDECAEILRRTSSIDLRTILYPRDEDVAAAQEELTQTAITQPALFVTSYALAKLWESWGVEAEHHDRPQPRRFRGGVRRGCVLPRRCADAGRTAGEADAGPAVGFHAGRARDGGRDRLVARVERLDREPTTRPSSPWSRAITRPSRPSPACWRAGGYRPRSSPPRTRFTPPMMEPIVDRVRRDGGAGAAERAPDAVRLEPHGRLDHRRGGNGPRVLGASAP